MWIIGFGFTAQVGKDTSALYLERKFPGRAKKVAFADKLKEICMDLYGLSFEQCYGSVEVKEALDPRYGCTPREILQRMGQYAREIHPDIWVDVVFRSVIPAYRKEGYDIFLISDVRYPNEAAIIKQHGGYIVRIDREQGGSRVGASHSSEIAMRDYTDVDFIVDNNGTFENLYQQLDKITEEFLHGRRSTPQASS